MKIILILLTLCLTIFSCTKEPSQELIENSIKKTLAFDHEFWDLSHTTINSKTKNSSFDSSVDFCEDLNVGFRLTLNKNCYLNNQSLLDNNVVIAWFKDLIKVDSIAMKVYEPAVCINDSEIQKELNEEISALESQIGKAKCYDLVEGITCQFSKVFTREMANEKIKILKDDVAYSLGKMKLYNSGYSENMSVNFRLCKMKDGKWDYWEKL